MNLYKFFEKLNMVECTMQQPEDDSDYLRYRVTKYFSVSVLVYWFIFIITIMIANRTIDEESISLFELFENHLFSKPLQQRGFEIPYSDLILTEDFWTYYETHFFERLFDDQDNSDNDQIQKNRYIGKSYILGPPRLRQVRVKENHCHVHPDFTKYYNACYAPYSKAAEETVNDFQGTRYQSESELHNNRFKGLINTYSGGGFVIPLTFNLNDTLDKWRFLRESKWIDRGTRLVLVEFSMINEDLHLIANMKIGAEFLPTGGFVPQNYYRSMRAYSSLTEPNFYNKFFLLFSFILLNLYGMYRIWQFVSLSGFFFYISHFWTSYGLYICICSWLIVIFEYWQIYAVKHLISSEANAVEADKILYYNTIYHYTLGFLIFALGIKFLRYLSLSQIFWPFTKAIAMCRGKLFAYMALIMLVVICYCQMCHLFFSEAIFHFYSFEMTLVSTMSGMVGDLEITPIAQLFPWTASLLFISLFVCCYLISTAVLMSIMFIAVNNVLDSHDKGDLNMFGFFHSHIKSFFTMIIPKKLLDKLSFFKSKSVGPNEESATVLTDPAADVSATDLSRQMILNKKVAIEIDEMDALLEEVLKRGQGLSDINGRMNNLLRRIAMREEFYRTMHKGKK